MSKLQTRLLLLEIEDDRLRNFMLKTKQKKKATEQPKKAKQHPAPSTKDRTLATRPQPTSKALTKAGDWESLAGAGQERMSQQDFAIPRLQILQDLSPQVQKRHEKYLDGAEPGDICDTVTGLLFSGDDGIYVVPVRYRRAYIEWIPRKKGGGFVADHDDNMDILSQCSKDEDTGAMVLDNGHEIKTTAEYFIFVADKETGEVVRYVLSMGGTQLKKSRRWNTMMNQYLVPSQRNPGTKVNPPLWFRLYKLTTVPERNDKGNWFGWEISPDINTFDLPKGQETFSEATRFHDQVKEGRVVAAAPQPEDMGPARGDEPTKEASY